MDFMDDLKDRATDVATATSKKVAEIYANTKLKLTISERKAQLRNLYRELGEIVYRASIGDGDDVKDDIEDKISEITLAREILDEMQKSEMQSKNLKACPYCDAKVPQGAKFCSNCGNEM